MSEVAAEPKVVCPMHRETKPKCWSFEQRKVYCRAKQREGELVLRRPKLPDGFQARVFKDSVRGEGRRVREQLVDLLCIGWW